MFWGQGSVRAGCNSDWEARSIEASAPRACVRDATPCGNISTSLRPTHSSRVRAECNYADFRPRVIQHFCTASDVVKQRSTSSDIVSPESIANSRRLCTRSVGILNCTGVQLPVNSCEGPLFLRRRDGVVGDSSVAASSDSPIGESATGCTGFSSRAAARTATARRNSGVPNAIEVSSMIPPPCRLP